jgi:hypothetical protein
MRRQVIDGSGTGIRLNFRSGSTPRDRSPAVVRSKRRTAKGEAPESVYLVVNLPNLLRAVEPAHDQC